MNQPLSRRSALALTGAGFLSTITMPAWAVDGARPGSVQVPRLTSGDRQVIAQLRPENALKHLRVLTEDIGMRRSGTPGENKAANYLGDTLEGYGYDVTLQPFSVGDQNLGRISSPALNADLCWDTFSHSRGALGVSASGRLVITEDGTGADLQADLTGMIVMPSIGLSNATDLALLVESRGGAGLVVGPSDSTYPRQTSARPPRLSAGEPLRIPVLGIGQVQKYALLDAAKAGTVDLEVSTTAHRNLTSYNVLATRPGQKGSSHTARRDVMVCAHYDSVVGARGANDDGSGTVLTVELARVLRNLPTYANVHFALWGSEEIGLVGSKYYVDQLSPEELARFSGVFNNDMVGTSWDPAETYWVLSYDGSANPVNAQVLASGDRLGYRAQMSDVTPRGASDHETFQRAGVPSGNFSWRGKETPALLEPGYHSADDTIVDNISMERLTVSMEIQGTAAYALASIKP